MPLIYFAGLGVVYIYGRYAESTAQLEKIQLDKSPGLTPTKIASLAFSSGFVYLVYKGLKKHA